MDKKNTILLTVIAIATLLVAVVGATFAYFATTQDLGANIQANVNTAGNAASFTSTSSGSIDIAVDSNKMQQAQSDDNTVIAELTDDDATLEVQLGAAQEGKSSVCTYDIIFTWTSEKYEYRQATVENPSATEPTHYEVKDAYYTRTIDPSNSMPIPKEFTIIATPTVTDPKEGESRLTSVIGTVPESGTNITATAETNFDEFPIEGQRKITDPNDTDREIDADYITLIKGLVIESSSTETKTKVNWKFTAKFYNSTKDQSVQMSKGFTGFITVNPDTIKC